MLLNPKSTVKSLTPAVGWQVSVSPAQGTSKRQGQDPGRHEGGPGTLGTGGNYPLSLLSHKAVRTKRLKGMCNK